MANDKQEIKVNFPEKLKGGVYEVPQDIDEQVANLKLSSLGLSIDAQSKEQKKYQCSWDIGT